MAKAKVRAKVKAQTKKIAKNIAKKVVKKAKSAKLVVQKKTAPKKKVAKSKPAAFAKKSATQSSTQKKASPSVVKKASVLASSQQKQKLVDVSDFVTPLDDRMIVQVKIGEKRTAGGLYIPDTVSNVSGQREGIVLSVGRGHRDPKGRLRPMDVKRGDQVLFSDYAGSKFEYNGQDLIILRETDVMGVLD